MVERKFVSSVQKELAAEREAVREFVRGDALLRRLFEVFLFEDLPAADRSTTQEENGSNSSPMAQQSKQSAS